MPALVDQQKRTSSRTAAPTGLPPTKPSTPKRRYHNNTFKKECDDDDAAAKGFPRYAIERGGTPDTLLEGLAAPSGATVLVSDKPTGISPDPRSPNAPENSTKPPTTQRHHDHEAAHTVFPRPREERPAR